ncbi:MAG TPA: hypothetical protein VKE70_19810 [Candidatus Solibacter sp.]|nr:hypothetical protein [Candidatus Solibacter sp.]
MKFAASLILAAAAVLPSFAADTVVRWQKVVGVITAPNVDNPVAGISAGTLPWTTRGGSARINLTTGTGSFDVEGLVLNGGNATGTPGPIVSVVGSLVCNPGGDSATGAAQITVDTPAAALSPQGNAELSFKMNVPQNCTNPLFLIRIPQFGFRWIAAGAVRTSGYHSDL